MRVVLVSSLALMLLVQCGGLRGQDANWFRVADAPAWESVMDERDVEGSEDEEPLTAHPVSFQPAPPPVIPFARPAETPAPAAARELSESLFGGSLIGPSLLERDRRTYPVGTASNVVTGAEARGRGSTDLSDLFGKSPWATGSAIQRRNPIITDMRIHSGRIGRQPGSGSYWVPARIDLDTTLSKIDSRLLRDVLTVNGPYAACYGPAFSHVDFQLWDAPRYEDGPQLHGSTSFDYKTNGQQWYGRQMLWGGSSDWGFRAGYGHRTGNDYTTGNGLQIPASYNSRDVDLALGKDLSCDSRIEFHGLRLDQTNVELPGQAFDIDWLGTDGYDVTYVLEDQPYFDRLDVNVWYNRTLLDGSAQRPGKRQQFPYYGVIGFEGSTDVDSMSTGFRWVATWGCLECERLSVGVDLRYLKQELNEITSGQTDIHHFWQDANSPIPRSAAVNPGVFVEYGAPWGERWTITSGARFDWAGQQLLADSSEIQSLGTQSLPLSDIVGSDDFDQSYEMFSLYLTGEYRINECWSALAAVGYAERPPSLTEMYAAETFMFVLQNGLNVVTGDPLLRHERLLQSDLGMRYDDETIRARVGGFYSWAWDYITFENMGFTRDPITGEIQQIEYKFVNTDLATFWGAELAAECDLTPRLTPFATVRYVAGTDRSRNGFFATMPSSPGNPSGRDPNLDRGAYSGIVGADREPLPSILPLESRLGIRFHQAAASPRWGIELTARVVDAQRRVAESLLELPTPGFTVYDVRGYWRLTDRLLTTAGIENFANKNYREHLDFSSQDGTVQVFQPGLNAYVSAELSY